MGYPHAFHQHKPRIGDAYRKYLTVDDVLALRQLPHIVATDGEVDYYHAFEIGQVSAKYNGKKVAGTLLEGNTSEMEDVVDDPLLEGRVFTEDEDERVPRMSASWPRYLGHPLRWTAGIRQGNKRASGLYTVIGVADKEKQPFGSGKNPYLVIPVKFPYLVSTCVNTGLPINSGLSLYFPLSPCFPVSDFKSLWRNCY